jgi:NAD(P)H-dependent FMN reductase
MLNLHVVVVSTRPGRAGPSVAKWFVEQASAHEAFNVRLVDLAEVNLPFLDEPAHPRLQDYKHQHTKDWSATVSAADAFVFVTPEYNYSAPATLVNALDYLYVEWSYKPAGFVSYGGVSGGTRSAQHAKQILTALRMMPIPEQVTLPFFTQHMKEGVFTPPDNQSKAAKTMLDELQKWSAALKPLRAT